MIEFIPQAERILLKGQLTQQSVCQLWPKKETCLASNTQVIDLSELIYIDSAGIAFLVLLWRSQQQLGKSLRFEAIPTQLQQLIALYELETVFNLA